MRESLSSGFVLRVATLEDIPQLHSSIERSVRVLQAKDYTAEQMDGALGHVLGVDTQLIKDQTYFIAAPIDEPNVFAGCGGWSFRRTTFSSDGGPGREASVLDPAIDSARIRAIFIDPAYARKGLGSLILKHCEDAARAKGFRSFEMGSTLTGLPLYRIKGYEERERLDVPLPNGETLRIVRMTKRANADAS